MTPMRVIEKRPSSALSVWPSSRNSSSSRLRRVGSARALNTASMGGMICHHKVTCQVWDAAALRRRSPGPDIVRVLLAPVAQGIERCPAEAEVACSIHAGRIVDGGLRRLRVGTAARSSPDRAGTVTSAPIPQQIARTRRRSCGDVRTPGRARPAFALTLLRILAHVAGRVLRVRRCPVPHVSRQRPCLPPLTSLSLSVPPHVPIETRRRTSSRSAASADARAAARATPVPWRRSPAFQRRSRTPRPTSRAPRRAPRVPCDTARRAPWPRGRRTIHAEFSQERS